MKQIIFLIGLAWLFTACGVNKNYKPLYEVQPEKEQFEEQI